MAAAQEKAQEAPASLVRKLEAAVGKENVKTSKMERLLYSHDLAPLPKETQLAFKNVPDVVVRPRSIADVQKIVKMAARGRRTHHPARGLDLGSGRVHACLRWHPDRHAGRNEQDHRHRRRTTCASPSRRGAS